MDDEQESNPQVLEPSDEQSAARGSSARLPWTAVVLGVAALGTAVAGAVLVFQLIASRPVQEATVGGMFLRLDRAEWLDDQMEHSETFPMPANMMPGMPPHGVFRLSVEVALHNPSAVRQSFRASELFFRSSERGMWPATGGELTEVELDPGQALNMFTHFDVADTEIEGLLSLLWVRGGENVQMLAVPHPPDHFHADEGQEVEWPPLVTFLPPGSLAAGMVLYTKTYSCISCHGHPDVRDSHTVGPHLGGIGTVAAGRVAGKTAAQYLYESILQPDAYIAPDCKNRPCASPSAMPPFGELLNLQRMADLLAFLLAQES